MADRPGWSEWAMGVANAVAARGDCTRRRVGCVILSVDHRIIGAGFNGTRPGGPSCLKGDCPRGRHYRVPCRLHTDSDTVREAYGCNQKCACGNAWPCVDAVLPGSSYDTGPGVCINSHAEGNAKADAMRRSGGDLDGCVMYVSCEPCDGCIRDIRNTTKIAAIRWPDGELSLP